MRQITVFLSSVESDSMAQIPTPLIFQEFVFYFNKVCISNCKCASTLIANIINKNVLFMVKSLLLGMYYNPKRNDTCIEYCPKQQKKGNRKQNGMKANRKQTSVKLN